MFAIPSLYEWMTDSKRPILNDLINNVGIGILRDEALDSLFNSCSSRQRKYTGNSGESSKQSGPDNFKIDLDVQQFKPEELKVTVSDGYIIVEGKHEECSEEQGLVSRQFSRKFRVPENIDETALVSSLSSDSVLTLKAPLKTFPEVKSQEITMTYTKEGAGKETIPETSGEKIIAD